MFLRQLRCSVGLGCAVMMASAAAFAAPAPQTPESEAARLAAQHGMRVEIESMTAQDPVVFTDLSPFVADDPPVRLPADQDLD